MEDTMPWYTARLLTCLFFLATASTHAAWLFSVGAGINTWDVDISGDAGENASLEKNGLNLSNEDATEIFVFFEHPVPFLPNVKIAQNDMTFSGSSDNSIRLIGDVALTGNIYSEADLSHNDLTLYWGLPLPIPLLSIDLGLTARQFDGYIFARNELNEIQAQELDFVLPLVYAGITVDTPFGVFVNAKANYARVAGNSFSDAQYLVGYNAPIPVPFLTVSVQAGYRSFNVVTDEDLTDIDSSIALDGVYGGATISFGF